jgi:hypothetical protein
VTADRSTDGWLEVDNDQETWAEHEAQGGALSVEGRRAAIAAVIPLLGVYFASGTQPLVNQSALAGATTTPDDATTELLAGLRLRVALAAASRLSALLARIVQRPTFRYQLTSVESAGAVSGQLDVNRFATRAGFTSDVATYPVLIARRADQTPENVLATYAALWLARELHNSFTASKAPLDGPEHHEQRRWVRALEETLRLPSLADSVAQARLISRGRDERSLLGEVKRRLRRREVANPTPYRSLVDWVERCLDGQPAAQPGDVEWSFYGPKFDTKLFELWCLRILAHEVARQLALDPPRLHNGWRDGEPAYSWDRPAGQLKLYFQRSIPAIVPTSRARWVRVDEQAKPLGGIPDIVAHAIRREDGRERFAVIDPKLRQRSGPPVEELYKVLGYLDNFGLRDNPSGAILFHTTRTDDLPSFLFAPTNGPGRLLALALNPARVGMSTEAMSSLATMLLGLLDIPPLAVPGASAPDETANDPDSQAERRVQARVRELLALANTLPANSLESSRRRIRALVGDHRWSMMSEETRTMAATAEHVGFSLDSSADFSGPVIGVCAVVEVLLHAQVIGPATHSDNALTANCRTLGQAIYAIRKAATGQNDPLSRALRTRMTAISADLAAVRAIIDPLAQMNTRYRVPAAHRELVSEATWRAAWDAVIGQGSLLSKTIDVFCAPGT